MGKRQPASTTGSAQEANAGTEPRPVFCHHQEQESNSKPEHRQISRDKDTRAGARCNRSRAGRLEFARTPTALFKTMASRYNRTSQKRSTLSRTEYGLGPQCVEPDHGLTRLERSRSTSRTPGSHLQATSMGTRHGDQASDGRGNVPFPRPRCRSPYMASSGSLPGDIWAPLLARQGVYSTRLRRCSVCSGARFSGCG